MNSKGNGLALPLLAVLGAMLGFQIGAALAKGLFSAVGPEGAAALRILVAALLLLVILRPWRSWPATPDWRALIGLGVCSALAILMFYMAIARLPQGLAIALQFFGPLGVAIVGSRKAIDWVWAGLALIGVWALLAGRLTGASLDPWGVVFAFGAAAGWAGYIVFGRATSLVFGRATPALATAIAAVIVLPVGVLHAGAALLNLSLAPLVLLVAVFSTALPFCLELYAMPRMPTRTFGVLMSLEPAFGATSGFLILHEALSPAQLAGIVAVILAAAGASWGAAGETPPALPIEP